MNDWFACMPKFLFFTESLILHVLYSLTPGTTPTLTPSTPTTSPRSPEARGARKIHIYILQPFLPITAEHRQLSQANRISIPCTQAFTDRMLVNLQYSPVKAKSYRKDSKTLGRKVQRNRSETLCTSP